MIITKEVNCKINIGLQVVRKRSDGYHDLQTIFYPTDFFTDILTIEDNVQSYELVCKTMQDIGYWKDNLCTKAFQLLQRDFQIPNVRIHLEKRIPTGAGLGGGSADAAFTLTMLKKLFKLPLTSEQLKEYAAQLGSDVPFFIENKPVYATGRGEIMSPLPFFLTDHEIRIKKPDFSVSTKEAYAGITPQMPEVELPKAIMRPMKEWKELIHNDFEDSIFQKYPSLKTLKQKFYEEGALYSSMTGSGTAVYGIF